MKHIPGISIMVLAFLIFLSGCKKKSEDNVPVILPDEIAYTDLIPDTTVTSVRRWISVYGDAIPIPSDSSASVSLDLDQDLVNDISLGAYTYYNFVSASNPGANYNYYAGVAMLDVKDSIAFGEIACYEYRVAKPFPLDSVISDSSRFGRSCILYSRGSFPTCSIYAPNGDTYLGFKLFRNGGCRYGWIQIRFVSMSLTIKAFAINRTLNKPIRAGQKQ